jgi:septal ring factor EnvC (AmiA/AmiB activator)
VDEKPDFGGTTAVVVWARKRLTPTVLWSAIGALVTALMVCITWIVTTQSDIHQLKEAQAESKKSVADLRQQLDLLNKIDTQIAVMTSKIDNIAEEVNRQREWRDRIEGIAETPPHPRRRGQ